MDGPTGTRDVRTCCKSCTARNAGSQASSCTVNILQECNESSTRRRICDARKAISRLSSERASAVSSMEPVVRFAGRSLLNQASASELPLSINDVELTQWKVQDAGEVLRLRCRSRRPPHACTSGCTQRSDHCLAQSQVPRQASSKTLATLDSASGERAAS
jgi:hypothetical protein